MASRGYHIPDSEAPFYDYQVSSWLMLESRDAVVPYQSPLQADGTMSLSAQPFHNSASLVSRLRFDFIEDCHDCLFQSRYIALGSYPDFIQIHRKVVVN
jgi:hypothetical protein